MGTATNSENLQQHKIKFYLIVEQILAFPSGINLEKFFYNFQTNY